MRIFEAILDDGRDVFKAHTYAKNIKQAKEECRGNGEIVRIKDVTEIYPIDTEKLRKVLDEANYGKVEIGYILAMLEK